MDNEDLKEMVKAFGENKTLQKLGLTDFGRVSLPKGFCRSVMIGIRRNTSLSETSLCFVPISWDCPINSRLVCNIVEAYCCVIREQKGFLSKSRNIDVIQYIRTFRPVGFRQLKKTHGSKCPDLL